MVSDVIKEEGNNKIKKWKIRKKKVWVSYFMYMISSIDIKKYLIITLTSISFISIFCYNRFYAYVELTF